MHSLILTLLLSFAFIAKSNATESICIGSKDAKYSVIYLHGMDSTPVSDQEMKNREILSKLANKYSFQFAIPRATMKCPANSSLLCWGWTWSDNELNLLIPSILESRLNCISPNKTFGLIGFSNGGYFLTQWYKKGIDSKNNIAFLIAIGASKGSIQTKIDLSKNPPLIMITGNQDKFNNDPQDVFANELKALKGNVHSIKFNGAHEINEKTLEETLLSLMRN